jgi:hypothetical protein
MCSSSNTYGLVVAIISWGAHGLSAGSSIHRRAPSLRDENALALALESLLVFRVCNDHIDRLEP